MTTHTLTYAEPSPSSGQFEYSWDKLAAPVVCILDYTPAEKQTHWEPGCPASASLGEAWLRGVDILPILSDAQIADIERAAKQDYEEMRQAERDEAAIERWKERRYA